MGALNELIGAARDRTAFARNWRAQGTGVVGYVGADVPVELLTAAGMLPLRLWGDPDGPREAGDRCLGTGLDPVARSVFTRLLDGAYGALDGLIVSRDCEASSRLFYGLRELRRVEPSVALPPIALADVLHLPHRTTTHYVHSTLARLRGTVATWAGHAITDLPAAIAAHDRLRTLLSDVAALRRTRPARITGTQALNIVAATTTMPVEHACTLLERLLDEAGTLPEHDGLRVYVTGSAHDTPEVYAELEANGFLVVGEDHDWGDLLFQQEVRRPTLLALAERYQHNGPSAPRSSIRRRAAHIAASARACHAEALLCYVREHDDAPPWDYPAQRDAAGLPSVMVRDQPYGALTPDADLSPLRTHLEVRT
ncbi:Benzoyl-CoA reductase/2-hydroxyglutaryl-CoA dehydratase subunit, BcrC/BadD/HgdB [Prauserella sp. Am3]|nr:Benzoyl-CoA reductase/2-hydroxyglutaryl-CoA dehydratase subunit, BcrC/BadD/HgdB [Prauserella sp. Am3]